MLAPLLPGRRALCRGRAVRNRDLSTVLKTPGNGEEAVGDIELAAIHQPTPLIALPITLDVLSADEAHPTDREEVRLEAAVEKAQGKVLQSANWFTGVRKKGGSADGRVRDGSGSA